MTNKLVKNLDEAMNADFSEDWQAKREAVRKARRDLFDAMHPDQQKAIREAYRAIALVTNAYREFSHPSYDDVVNLDASLWDIRNAFAMDEE